MTVLIRPHHLLCLLTFVGKGYTPAFTANMAVIAGRLAGGEALRITDGPDDICAPYMGHCLEGSIAARDAAAARDVSALLGLPIEVGVELTLTPARITVLRAAFAQHTIRKACAACDWAQLCTGIGADGYKQAVL